MSGHAFVDETKTNGLLLVVAVIASSDLDPMRKSMRQLRLAGQDRIHFSKESARRRRDIAQVIGASQVLVDVYDATQVAPPHRARGVALRRIVTDIADRGVQRLVIEQDDSVLRHDRTVLYQAVRDAGVQDSLSYVHLPARSEPLLWIPDAVAWCWTHGIDWQRRVSTLVRGVHRL